MSFSHPIWTRFLRTNVVLNLATLGPVGRLRKAPGTWGSLAGVMYHLALFHYLRTAEVILWSALASWFAVAICGEAEFRLGRRDPGEVVLDEFVAMPLCFIGWRSLAVLLPTWAAPWSLLIAGFALFRLFDILKPFGISKLQDLPGGWGVVVDDLAAALATCATLHLGAWLWIHFHG